MKETNRRRHVGRIAALSVAAAGVLASMTLPAQAADGMSADQIMADCASGVGKCTFNDPKIGKAFLGNQRRVSDELHNCSSSDATQTLSWSDTVGSSDSAGVTISAGGKIAGIIDVSVQASYSHTWSSSHSETSSLTVTVKPGEVGWVSRAQAMQNISGTWQTHYDSPKAGHYYWYLPDTVTGPAPNGTDGVHNAVVVKTRPMTATEKKSCTTRQVKAFRVAR
ncbi:hypothetical protein ACH427_31705 [Streptomyces sp. NPDC020379]|uniref:hypothetical protein n=1 Tax=Streptomyces sp. NPDC020379 TaxID=3365071 RepID=UPI003796094B